MLAFTETKLIYIQNKGYRRYRVGRMHLFDAEAGARPLFQKKKI